ncbi:DNA polymerase IV [Natrialbaceae archaeon A-CW1-1]
MTDDPSLPGVETTADDEDRIVLHVDADCFYAACERLREPDLEGEPVVVGMGYEPGDTIGAVATASYEARAFGVESAQAISTALENLPRRAGVEADPELTVEETGHYRSVDMEYYQSVAADVKTILHDCADVVREVSVDEAYLDVTDRTAWAVAAGFARHVKDRIRREVGITVSIGVAPSMSAAKIASDFDKPDGLTVVRPGEVREFLAPLEVDLLHGVGPVTARELRSMGLETAADVAATDPEPLVERFGERGRELYERARGDDDRPVEPKGLPKSFSRESAFSEAVEEPNRKRELVETLAAAVAERAQREGALYRTVGVKAVTPPYDVNTRERSLPGPVDNPDLVREIALELFAEFETVPVRKLGVKVANLEFSEVDQASLDDVDWNARTTTDSRTSSDPGTDSRSGERRRSTADPSDPEQAALTTLLEAHSNEEDTEEPSQSDSRTDRSRDSGQASLEEFE